MANQITNVGFSDYAAEQAEIERRRAYAQALQQQGMQPMGGTEMAGGWAIPNSPTQGLAKMLQAYSGQRGMEQATEQQKALGQRYQSDLARTLMEAQQAGAGAPGSPMPAEELGGGPAMPAVAPDRQAMARILMGHPATQAMGMQELMPKKPVVVGRSLLNPDTGAVVGQDATWKAEQDAARKARESELAQRQAEAQRAEAARIAEAQRAEQARFDQARQMAGVVAGLRQPQQDQIIQTAEGPMRLVNGQAVPITGPSGAPVKPAAGRGGQMTATAQKELIETEEQMQGGQAALGLFKQARTLNDKAMGGMGAGTLANIGTILPDGMRPATVDATQNLDNILQTAALPQLKAIFGGMPTEGERKILLDVQGSSSKPAKVRKEIFDRAETAIQARIKFAAEKAKRLRDGTYFSGEGLPSLQPDSGGRNAQDTAALQWANANPNDPRAAAIKQRLGAQ